jgi:hypothetical protein
VNPMPEPICLLASAVAAPMFSPLFSFFNKVGAPDPYDSVHPIHRGGGGRDEMKDLERVPAGFGSSSPDLGSGIDSIPFFGYRGGCQEKESRPDEVVCRSVEHASMETTTIFRSTLWEAHHQGRDAGNSALPLLLMAEWLLSPRSLTSIGCSSEPRARARRRDTPKWFVPGGVEKAGDFGIASAKRVRVTSSRSSARPAP